MESSHIFPFSLFHTSVFASIFDFIAFVLCTLVQNLLALGEQIPTLAPTVLVSSTKHPQNTTLTKTRDGASGQTPQPQHRGSNHPKEPHNLKGQLPRSTRKPFSDPAA
jgi:hypothetical protein